MASSQTGAYVRLAEPHEYDEVVEVLTRAFARDPAMNFYGSVKNMVPPLQDIVDFNTLPSDAKGTLDNLRVFQWAVVEAVILTGGFITVVVLPREHEEGLTTNSPTESIAGATLWLKPGQTLDLPLMTLIRSGIWKVILAWGFSGVKRVLIEYSPAVERSLQKSFKAHSMDRLDSWHLLETVVDPLHQGKGFCGLMMKDGFKRTHPKPVHLEATSPKNRLIYEHFGFEVDEEYQFGRGAVDTNGIPAKGKAATGFPEWVMTKWRYT